MSSHYCPGEDCAYCQRRIEAIEYERDCPAEQLLRHRADSWRNSGGGDR